MAKWSAEFEALRAIALACGLTEQVKWGCPCFTDQGRNIVLIHGFKDYCAYLFFKGALMADPQGLLIQQTENVQAARQIRFTALAKIEAKSQILKDYIAQAIAIEAAGLTIDKKKTEDFAVPEEFRQSLDDRPDLAEAFAALTPGRQRAYLLHFSSAKQTRTRQSRVEAAIPRILAGKGLMD